MGTKIISNRPYTFKEYFEKLSRYGFLTGVLAKRELKIRYSRTLLGIGWLFIQPLVGVIVYSLFFNKLISIDSQGIPYPSFVFSGLVIWYIFTGVVTKGAYALIESADLINKVSFPRLIIVIAKVLPVIFESMILFVFLLFLVIFTLRDHSVVIFTAVFYFVQISILSLSVGLAFSAIAIRFRDLLHIIPFALNFGIWLTPVFYPTSLIPEVYQKYFLYLNPLSLSIEGLRGALFFEKGISNASFLAFVLSCFFMFLSFYFFVKFERKIVEKL